MTKNIVFCVPDDLASKAAMLMKNENVGSIPVIEDEKTRKLVGIVTDRDLTLKVLAEGLDAESTRVDAVMTRKIVTCLADDSLHTALDVMAEHQLRRLPVVTNKNKILGMISQADIALRYNHPKRTAAMVKRISQSFAK
jgi:CBS domain-containing protein